MLEIHHQHMVSLRWMLKTHDMIQTKVSSLTLKSKGFVTYGDNNKMKILGIGKVGMPPFTTIDDVLYVGGLKHKLLITVQLCDKGLKINFNKCMYHRR